MQIGAWKSYDELESSLTLEELYELYHGIMYNKIEEFKNMARANGATFEDKEDKTDGGKDSNAFDRVLQQARERKGVEAPDRPTSSKLGVFNINNV